jgi:hypothetical protein
MPASTIVYSGHSTLGAQPQIPSSFYHMAEISTYKVERSLVQEFVRSSAFLMQIKFVSPSG